MNSREINKIIGRIKFWKGELSAQHQMKKADRNQRTIKSAESRIAILKGWLKDTVISVGPGKVAVEKKVTEIMSKDEFKKVADAIMGTSAEPAAVMVIHDRKTLDQVYDKIKLSNIQISAPPSVLAYYKEKLRNERPYKL